MLGLNSEGVGGRVLLIVGLVWLVYFIGIADLVAGVSSKAVFLSGSGGFDFLHLVIVSSIDGDISLIGGARTSLLSHFLP